MIVTRIREPARKAWTTGKIGTLTRANLPAGSRAPSLSRWVGTMFSGFWPVFFSLRCEARSQPVWT